MLWRRMLLISALAACGSLASALPVRIMFDWPAGRPAALATPIRIQAFQSVSYTNSSVPVEAEGGPSGAALDLGAGVWRVQASAPGYWSQAVEVTVGGQGPAGVRLALWPAATLHGTIGMTGALLLPAAVDLRLNATPAAADTTETAQTPAAPDAPGPSSAHLHCPIAAGSWSCAGPAGRYDVRVAAAGYVPRYLWGVSLKTGESADLGATDLLQAASVFGRAARQDGSEPPGPCWATLESAVERHEGPSPDADSAPADEQSFMVPLNPRGYFQMAGVMAGKHLLDVMCPAASGRREVLVQPQGETWVDPPLTLEELTLAIAITPKADPAGQPWRLSVDETDQEMRGIADGVAASAEGRWQRRGLMTGSYRLVVRSSDGTAWLVRYFDLNKNSGPLLLHLASVKVAGRALLNAQPVRARLLFSNEAGGEPVILNSDEQGDFHGLLPIPGEGRESRWNVEAQVAQPRTDRRVADVDVPSVAPGATAWVDLELPTIAVRGSVVSENGQPQHGIEVVFVNTVNAMKTTTSTDGNGSFEMPDLLPGKYTARADSPDGVSDPVPFEVTDGSESQLQLILHPSLHAAFYVVSSVGPVADATVQIWIAPGVPRAFAHTDQNGRFTVTLPPGSAEVGLTVGADGYALQMVKKPVPSPGDPSGGANQEANQDANQNVDPSANPAANTVTLNTSGGTLALNLEPSEGALDRSATLYLVHNGAIQDARTIAGWGSDPGGSSGEDPAVVDTINPGDYALCVVENPSQLALLWSGALPPERCSVGTVKQGQTLTLTPKLPPGGQTPSEPM